MRRASPGLTERQKATDWEETRPAAFACGSGWGGSGGVGGVGVVRVGVVPVWVDEKGGGSAGLVQQCASALNRRW